MNEPSAATSGSPSWVAIVPTLGASPHLAESVDALRVQGGRVVVVAPAGLELDLDEAAIRRVSTDGSVGFARANLAGFHVAPAADYVALVNDDAVVEDGWAAALLAELETHPEAAAAQGVVVSMDEPRCIDGAGLGWNRWWQAVQLGHGETVDVAGPEAREVFGVSATAAIYRRRALDQVAPVFDAALDSYYEDVDLAVRLRAAGWTARSVPSARARHAGSATGTGRGAARLVRRNRYPVLARALGRRLLPRLPWIVLRDMADALRALLRLDLAAASAIVFGTLAGLARLLPDVARGGLLTLADLRRWQP